MAAALFLPEERALGDTDEPRRPAWGEAGAGPDGGKAEGCGQALADAVTRGHASRFTIFRRARWWDSVMSTTALISAVGRKP